MYINQSTTCHRHAILLPQSLTPETLPQRPPPGVSSTGCVEYRRTTGRHPSTRATSSPRNRGQRRTLPRSTRTPNRNCEFIYDIPKIIYGCRTNVTRKSCGNTPFLTKYGQSACNLVKVRPISTVRSPNHARMAAEMPNR